MNKNNTRKFRSSWECSCKNKREYAEMACGRVERRKNHETIKKIKELEVRKEVEKVGQRKSG